MTKSFECKLKGRLGTGPDDCKEMRVLNRIVRISDKGVLYEADPRHAEMLVKAFNLEGAKGVVTPGVKTVVDQDVDPAKVDAEATMEMHRILADLKMSRSPHGKVQFCSDVDVHEVPAYPHVYGRHPRDVVFNRNGRMVTPPDEVTLSRSRDTS